MKKEYKAIVTESFDTYSEAVVEDFDEMKVCFKIPFAAPKGSIVTITFELQNL